MTTSHRKRWRRITALSSYAWLLLQTIDESSAMLWTRLSLFTTLKSNFNTYFLIERQLICFFPPQEQTDQYRRPSKLGSNEDIFASACDDGVLRLFDISQSISGTTLVFFLLKFRFSFSPINTQLIATTCSASTQCWTCVIKCKLFIHNQFHSRKITPSTNLQEHRDFPEWSRWIQRQIQPTRNPPALCRVSTAACRLLRRACRQPSQLGRCQSRAVDNN